MAVICGESKIIVGAINGFSDRETGKCRGFGFVEMEPAEAYAAIKALKGA